VSAVDATSWPICRAMCVCSEWLARDARRALMFARDKELEAGSLGCRQEDGDHSA